MPPGAESLLGGQVITRILATMTFKIISCIGAEMNGFCIISFCSQLVLGRDNLKGKRLVGLLVVLLGILCASSCIGPGSPSDEEIITQVKTFFNGLNKQIPWDSGKVSFVKYFSIEDIKIDDKKVEKDKVLVICRITIKVNRRYASDSGVSDAYQSMLGPGGGSVGERKSFILNATFEKFEKGWRFTKY